MTSTTASERKRGENQNRSVAPAFPIRSLCPLLRHRHRQEDTRRAVSPAPGVEASWGSWRAPSPQISTALKAGLERPVFSEGIVSNRDGRNRRPPPNHIQEYGCRAGWCCSSLTLPSSRARAPHTVHARRKVRALPKLRHARQRS